MLSQDTQSVPDGNKRESEKETEGSSKFRNQRGERVDQLLNLNIHLVWDRPKRKHVEVWF